MISFREIAAQLSGAFSVFNFFFQHKFSKHNETAFHKHRSRIDFLTYLTLHNI